LMPNPFVDVRIFGNTLGDVVALPRHALREGEKVWVFDDGSLRVLDVKVARADRERVYVSAGLEEGDEVIVSALDAVTDGMKIRAAGGDRGGSAAGSGK
jgi:membrane fusion protein, multidrug efflux system